MKNEAIKIVFECCDETFSITMVSLCSIIQNTKSQLDFYILDCGINNSNTKIMTDFCYKHNCALHFIPINFERFSGLKGYTSKNFLDCYSRLIIPELLPNIDKAIYLDSDTICIGDIRELWSIDLQGKAIGAVYDLAWGNFIFKEKAQIESEHKFINAGVLLLDCQQWRDKKISEKCFLVAKEYKEYLGAIIEDIFSVVFKNKDVLLLPFRFGFNELPNRSRFLGEGHTLNFPQYLPILPNDTIIVHFTGANKPWKRMYKWNLIDSFDLIEKQEKKKIAFFDDFWNFAFQVPVYPSLLIQFIKENIENGKNLKSTSECSSTHTVYFIKLFNLIPFLKIIKKRNIKRVYLFGFIPLLKIKEK